MLVIGADLTSTLVEWLLGSKEGGRGMCNNINFGIVTDVVVSWGENPPLSLPFDGLCLHLSPICLSFSLHPVSLFHLSLSPPNPPFLCLPLPPSLSPHSFYLYPLSLPSTSLYFTPSISLGPTYLPLTIRPVILF